MFGKLVTVAAIAGLATASPVEKRNDRRALSFSSGFNNNFNNGFNSLSSLSNGFNNVNSIETIQATSISFNNFGGFSNFNNFDDFFGVNNFLGNQNQIVFIEIDSQPVCNAIDINIIQQQLSILSETAKRIFLSEFCDVELQVIALQQFLGRFDDFARSLRRSNGRDASFDFEISQLIGQLLIQDVLNTNDFGFNGLNIGQNSVRFLGDNWGRNGVLNSVNSVGNAFNQAFQARVNSLGSGIVSPDDATSTATAASSVQTANDITTNGSGQ